MASKLAPFEKKIGYRFKNKELLIQALTHSSYAYECQENEPADNEVLEFLGDSVLGMVVADYLVGIYPTLSEGELSKLKSSAGSTSSLSLFAKKLKLDKYIFLGKGEQKSGGRNKKTILAGAFEALVAAVYLDGGLNTARKFILAQIKPHLKRINVKKFFINNYKSALQEYIQKESLQAPRYKTVTTKGPDHKKVFIVEVFSEANSLAKAKGPSKKEAEQRAAQKALKSLLGRKIKGLSSDTFLVKKKP